MGGPAFQVLAVKYRFCFLRVSGAGKQDQKSKKYFCHWRSIVCQNTKKLSFLDKSCLIRTSVDIGKSLHVLWPLGPTVLFCTHLPFDGPRISRFNYPV
jgi:hypothetical protein